jgi:hypothetical protein
MLIPPETKDWTWVLAERCPECGFDTSQPRRDDLAALASTVGDRWVAALAEADDLTTRPAPLVWSPLEYACHVRDVFGLASYRCGLMRDEDDPLFANWDQDTTAVEDDYASQDPAVVSTAIAANAAAFAEFLAGVPDEDWDRPGRRSDGAAFTVRSFARYLLHDPLHHLWDIGTPR